MLTNRIDARNYFLRNVEGKTLYIYDADTEKQVAQAVVLEVDYGNHPDDPNNPTKLIQQDLVLDKEIDLPDRPLFDVNEHPDGHDGFFQWARDIKIGG
jgi:hypothetical protein